MKKVFNLIIVDESGSMWCIQNQTIAGINETVQTVQTAQKEHPELEQRITLITFSSERNRMLLDNAPAMQAEPVNSHTYRPNGGTPLYDAIGMGIAKVNAQAGPEDKVLVTIITDGMENDSKEYTHEMVTNLIEKLKKQGWLFTLIGTEDLDVESMGRSMGIKSTLGFTRDDAGTRRMFAKDRKARMNFMACMCRNEDVAEDAYFAPDPDKK